MSALSTVSREVFMAKDGQKYTVDKGDNGQVSLRPQSGTAAISVQDNSARTARGDTQGDQRATVNTNAAGAAADRAAVADKATAQQAQQRQEVQRADKSADAPYASRRPRQTTGRPDKARQAAAEKPEPTRQERATANDSGGDKSRVAKTQPAPEADHNHPVAGSGSGGSNENGGDRGANKGQTVETHHTSSASRKQPPGKINQDQQSSIKVGSYRPPRETPQRSTGMDRNLDQVDAKANYKPTETAPPANARTGGSPPGGQGQNQTPNKVDQAPSVRNDLGRVQQQQSTSDIARNQQPAARLDQGRTTSPEAKPEVVFFFPAEPK